MFGVGERMTVIKKTAEEIENILRGGGWQRKDEYWFHPMFRNEPFQKSQALSVERSRTDKSLEELPSMNNTQLLGYVHKQRAKIEELKGVTADDMVKLIKAEKKKDEQKQEKHACKCSATMTILDEDDAKQLFDKVKELSDRLESVEKDIDTLMRGFNGMARRLKK